MYRNCGDINYVCRKYHISRTSLWRWNKKYDGTKESITDKSHKPKRRHPNAHTNQEIRWIRNYVRRNPRITLCELWAKLKREKGYTRTITALYRLLEIHSKIYWKNTTKNMKIERARQRYPEAQRFYFENSRDMQRRINAEINGWREEDDDDIDEWGEMEYDEINGLKDRHIKLKAN